MTIIGKKTQTHRLNVLIFNAQHAEILVSLREGAPSASGVTSIDLSLSGSSSVCVCACVPVQGDYQDTCTQRQKISAPACACHRDNQQRGPIGCATQYDVAWAEIVYFFASNGARPSPCVLWLRNVEGRKVESQQGCVGPRTSPAPFRATISTETSGSDKTQGVLFHGTPLGWCRAFGKW